MKPELQKYNCHEYLNGHYSVGMFHPTEACDLFPHEKMILNEEEGYLQIGEIWDDFDSKICYRRSKYGIWGKYNYDGTYYFLSTTLKELVEVWYPNTSNYWSNMKSSEQWKNIARFYQFKIKEYRWDSLELLNFINQGIENKILEEFFLKGYDNRLEISSINGFGRRPFNNFAVIQYNHETKEYNVYFKDSFFKNNFLKGFKRNEIEPAMKSIKKWIRKETAQNNG